MIGVYFSGTGNTRFCVEQFLRRYGCGENAFSIEDGGTLEKIRNDQELVIGYPVQYSNIPKLLREYIIHNRQIWSGKRIFVIATMGLFSGDGAGLLARLLKRCGADVVGGLHLKMPDSIGDVRALKRSFQKNRELVIKAQAKLDRAVRDLKAGKPPREGLGIGCHLAGLFGQRLWFFWKTKNYTDKLKINALKCIGCGLCEKLCPMRNITLTDGLAVPGDRCTMCYRCVSRCPKQAITLLGKEVFEQNDVTKYL